MSTTGRRTLLATFFTIVLFGAPFLLGTPNAQSARPVGTRQGSGRSAPMWGLVASLLRTHSSTAASALDAATAAAPTDPPTTTTEPPPTTTTEPPTTTTTEPPTTTTTEPPTTTTTEPPTTTTTVAGPSGGGGSVHGVATWYAAAADGTCASPTLPFGTRLLVVNDATGARTTCVVDDREGDIPGRVVDLSYNGFAQIAPPSQGVVDVTVSW